MSRVYNMDLDWGFSNDENTLLTNEGHRQIYLSTKAGTVKGPASKNFDDSHWRRVDLPHDYVIETDISQENGNIDCHKKGSAWYRKCFSLDDTFSDKQIAICFEGIAIQSEIYINGSLIRRSFSSYTEQFVDITDRIYIGGKPNTIAVHVNAENSLAECWSYEGGGIYRHVKLYAKNKFNHIAHNGIFAYPELVDEDKKKWKLNVQTELENISYKDSSCDVNIQILDKDNVILETNITGVKIEANSNKIAIHSFDVSNPVLWDVDNPYQYRAKVSIKNCGEIVDTETVKFGYRYYRFDSNEGFFLNGRWLKLKGVCCHQDHAGVGVAVPDNLQRKRIEILKDMGANTYRSAHNNPAREILDACDELGVLVIDENRHFEASKENLEHLQIITKRDRNHPSVFLYCLLNEEPLQNTQEGAQIFKRMKEEVKKYDWTRLFTGAMHGNVSGAGHEMDVCGINYGYGYLDALHKDNPNVCILGSEDNSQLATRGCYETDMEVKHVVTSYDDVSVPWGSTAKKNWAFARDRKYLAGVTVWTGFDYHGEAYMPWPSVNSSYGMLDICGFYKDNGYANKACYSTKPFIKLIPHWNHKKGDVVRVVALSNCEQTELIVNGKLISKADSDCCNPNEWNIPFEAGYIEANGYIGGKKVVSDKRVTAKSPKSIEIETNGEIFNNSGNDTIIINCHVEDEDGVISPLADNKLFFDISGEATLIGVGNGDSTSHENEVIPERKLYNGYLQAIFRVKYNAKNVEIKIRGQGLKEKIFVPKIIDRDNEDYIFSCKNNYIMRLEATSAKEEWIDPKMKVDINDMNTFLPVEIEEKNFQKDFRRGWKLYRVFLKLPQNGETPKEKDYSIYFDDVRVNKMFVFVDDKEIYKLDVTHRYTLGSINCEFKAKENTTVELRVLVHINIENEEGCGFRKSIRLI